MHAVRLRLLSPAGTNNSPEDYEFSLPSVFARSILTVPWVELGDKVTVHCQQTGYSASIVFHTKVSYRCHLRCRHQFIPDKAGQLIAYEKINMQ